MKELCCFVARVMEVNEGEVFPETGPMTLPEWDSFRHVFLAVKVEEIYGVELSAQEITDVFCVKDLAAILEAKGIEVR